MIPSGETSRSISAASAVTALSSRQRQASTSRNSRASTSTNLAGCVSPIASCACAVRAWPTIRSRSPPADPPARFVRAIHASAQVAASQVDQRSAAAFALAISSRLSPIAVSRNAIRWALRLPLATTAASDRSRCRPSNVSMVPARRRIRPAASRAVTLSGFPRGGRGCDRPLRAAASAATGIVCEAAASTPASGAAFFLPRLDRLP